MISKRLYLLPLGLALATGLANADITYTCAANIDTLGPADTCNVLNSTNFRPVQQHLQ
jgi:hypothetical protein